MTKPAAAKKAGKARRQPARPVVPSEDKALTPKERLFVLEYIVDLNATKAAIRVGYSAKTAAQIGYENLRKPHIAKAIDEAIKERADRLKVDASWVLQRLMSEATADIADIYGDDGSLLPVSEWPLEFRTGLVAGIEVEELWEGQGDERTQVGLVRKIKLSERHKRIELIGKHVDVQAFKERREVDIPEGGPLAQLAKQLSGTSIRPNDPEDEDE